MSNRFAIIFSRIFGAIILLAVAVMVPVQTQAANRTDIVGPAGSAAFGTSVTVLSNGNFVVTDPRYSPIGGPSNIGAVYLYDGETLELISTLMGSQAGDYVGGRVTALTNGNFVVESSAWHRGDVEASAVTWCSGNVGCSGEVSISNSLVGANYMDGVQSSVIELSNGNYIVKNPVWHNGAFDSAGAVTFCSGSTGCVGERSSSNSLVGTHNSDNVGGFVFELPNGNYIVISYSWSFGTTNDLGAVTWCSGTSGCIGPVSEANSVVGSQPGDKIGYRDCVKVLSNGNYVICNHGWDNGSIVDAGAVRLCSGLGGCTGEMTPANSLVGSQEGDQVSYWDDFGYVFTLANGNYVIVSSMWDNGTTLDVGAVTWCSGITGCQGAVSLANSVIGSETGEFGGIKKYVIPLSNGNYVVRTPTWDNGSIIDAGAVRWCSGDSGCIGPLTATNSLVGSHVNDQVNIPTPLPNGNYVVSAAGWDNGNVPDVGSLTWCSGTTGCAGPVSETNSVIGSHTGDGGYPAALPNGNYVGLFPGWDNGAVANAGAVRWCSGVTGCTGSIDESNSLVGTHPGDQLSIAGSVVGFDPLPNGNYIISSANWNSGAGAITWCSGISGCIGPVTANNSVVGQGDYSSGGLSVILTNGNYVLSNPWMNNGSVESVGAVRWCNGTIGCAGALTADNSLMGTQAYDSIGSGGVVALTNGNYVVSSQNWRNGVTAGPGAVTWCNGSNGCIGQVTETNSLFGSKNMDYYEQEITALPGGSYVIFSPNWDNGPLTDSGAITWTDGIDGSSVGPITGLNSVLGEDNYAGSTLKYVYDHANHRLFVSRPADEVVSILAIHLDKVFLPVIRR